MRRRCSRDDRPVKRVACHNKKTAIRKQATRRRATTACQHDGGQREGESEDVTVAPRQAGPPEAELFQPLLHDLAVTVSAPCSALSGHDGQIRHHGVQGVFVGDCRVLSQAILRINAVEPSPIAHAPDGASGATFVSLARALGDPGPDPTVRIERVRRVAAAGMTEEIRVVSAASVPVRASLTIDLACDLAPMDVVRIGRAGDPGPGRADGDGLCWSTAGVEVRITADGASIDVDKARLTWTVDLPPRSLARHQWTLQVTTTAIAVGPAPGPAEWSRPRLVADDRRLVRLLERSLDDLAALRLVEPGHPEDTFLGAGVPWFLTLFGRDSLWAARMLLPFGTDLARGTLRVLARRQGRRLDSASGEAPGKIMHELRYGSLFGLTAESAPVVYYGTIDATLLWIDLLHEAWRWGLAEADVAALLPNLQAALGWLADHADPDGDGFLEYIDDSRGLANQGWKDSADAVRFRDGRRAQAPIALCEVQGYAYQAAMGGAALLEAFGLPDAARWREYAAALAQRFRDRFWVDGPDGPYPALALDRDKRPVDALTSNIGHLLGTGLLNAEESARVARHLASPAMSGGYGLRTMSADSGGYNPLSYHCGSVWPHDTAIVLARLARDGHDAAAAVLAEGLLSAAEAFGYQLPELYGGDDRTAWGRPAPYPASCHPQAWSAAAGVAILQAALGIYPDVPHGTVHMRPLAGAPLGAIDLHGLRIAGAEIAAAVTRDGQASLTGLPASLRVVVPTPTPVIPTQPVGPTEPAPARDT
ncbi:MAG: amylo-alpha-1,6-glucosidase [Micromonosporaceae bacterium]|nr:amylo-alpha-1,6-glucosidase [Micromonosporaceae bacterium]